MAAESSLLEALSNMSEDDFTRTIIIPLFEALGYQWSQFNGGAYEEGVDHLAYRVHEITDEAYVVCVQSKKIDNSEKTKPRGVLSDIIHQLRQCLMNKQRLPNGKMQNANEAYLAIPGVLNPRLRNEIFGQLEYQNLEVKLLEGPKILNLLQKKAPNILEKLLEHPSRLKFRNDFLNGNEPLNNVLYSKSPKNITDFYCDLEFFIGQKSERSIITKGLELLKSPISINETDVSWFVNIHNEISKRLQTQFITTNLPLDFQNYKENLKIYNSQDSKKTFNNYELELKSLNQLLTSLEQKITDSTYSIQINKSQAAVLINTLNEWRMGMNKSINEQLIAKLDGGKKLYYSILKQFDNVSEIKKALPQKPELKIQISSEFIEEFLEVPVKKHLKLVSEIENGKGDKSKVWSFLEQAKDLLELQSLILSPSSPIFSYIDSDNFFSIDNKISFPPSLIFDSGQDIALFGGAGFGKTTTLQSYAAKCLRQKSRDCIFIELSKHKESFKKYIPSIHHKDSYDKEIDQDDLQTKENTSHTKLNSDGLIKGILDSYSCDVGPTSVTELKKVLESTTLLLDGIDEIYSYIPQILKVIKDFKSENNKCQVILSTRNNTEYLSKIEFLGISLLPFTEDKLKSFIDTWLDDQEMSSQLWKTICAKNIKELVCNPLLATISCSLIQQGVQIPTSESKLYEKRLELLSGLYDTSRDLKRQKSDPEFIREAAKKVAFIMHQKQVRSISKNEIKNDAYLAMKNRYTKEAIYNAIDELVDPCNILVLDEISNHVSFGHFRYQENLVSQGLKVLQHYALIKYLHITFWRGAFTLLAEDIEIDGIFDELLRNELYIDSYDETLIAMINNSPINHIEKQGYLDLKNMLKHKHSNLILDC